MSALDDLLEDLNAEERLAEKRALKATGADLDSDIPLTEEATLDTVQNPLGLKVKGKRGRPKGSKNKKKNKKKR